MENQLTEREVLINEMLDKVQRMNQDLRRFIIYSDNLNKEMQKVHEALCKIELVEFIIRKVNDHSFNITSEFLRDKYTNTCNEFYEIINKTWCF